MFFNQEGATTCACCKTDFPAYSGYDWCTEKTSARDWQRDLLKFVLANPENDARDMKAALEEYGFDVIGYETKSEPDENGYGPVWRKA